MWMISASLAASEKDFTVIPSSLAKFQELPFSLSPTITLTPLSAMFLDCALPWLP